jgi:uncharacterized damage-inducible protein DinB
MRYELIAAFEADLSKLMEELNAFPDDESLWKKLPGASNSPGNLMLHLMGNLNHYIGAKLGNSGYVRDRPVEFTDAGISLAEMKRRLEETQKVVVSAINGLSDEDFGVDYLTDESDDRRTIRAELIHILTHLNYHLGQINYHRRLASGA